MNYIKRKPELINIPTIYLSEIIRYKYVYENEILSISCITITSSVHKEFPQLQPTNPIIIIPGIKGTQLVDPITEKVILGKIFI
ncbi:MAG: hypothetical protein KAS35_04430 [Candidatus Marinimicrobia bacterium]|nr:hypothetical protein [Candidatus Neomarinimicrobiota bacterium]